MYAAYPQKTSIGIIAGGTLSNYKIVDNGEDRTSDSRPGFTAGLIANIPTGKNFMIQTGALWVQKGTRDEEAGEKVTLTVSSIEIPVTFLYNSDGGFFFGAGPSAAFAVSGKWKYNDVSVKAKIGNSNDDDMKGFDFGANVLTGYQSRGGFLIMANFNQGFSNLIPGDAENTKLRTHYFGIRLGYMLNGKNKQ
jgi:hypothetical protein